MALFVQSPASAVSVGFDSTLLTMPQTPWLMNNIFMSTFQTDQFDLSASSSILWMKVLAIMAAAGYVMCGRGGLSH